MGALYKFNVEKCESTLVFRLRAHFEKIRVGYVGCVVIADDAAAGPPKDIPPNRGVTAVGGAKGLRVPSLFGDKRQLPNVKRR